MKKILSAYCCMLCIHTAKSIPAEVSNPPLKLSGEKVLVKALTALLNREEGKKRRGRRIELPASGCPWL